MGGSSDTVQPPVVLDLIPLPASCVAHLNKMLAQRSALSRGVARAPATSRRVAVPRPRLAPVRAVPEVTDASFADDVLNSSTPVLVDFWAPCRWLKRKGISRWACHALPRSLRAVLSNAPDVGDLA